MDISALFRQHYAELVRLAVMLVGDRATAEDVVQDVFAKLHARRDREGPSGDPLAYVRACVLNGCRTVLRRRALLRRFSGSRERIGAQPYAFMQAGLDAVAARGPAELGPAWRPARQAGQVLGRDDQIAGTLWPTENREAAPRANGGLPLTPREGEVAELIAGGLTNRQIAARLFIAERTADTHVSNILAKLGCASRAQVAAIIAARNATGAITRTKGAPGRGGG